MTKCADTPTKTYTAGENFTLWFGGINRAKKRARNRADYFARAMISKHNSEQCYKAYCDETWVGGETGGHYLCRASGEFKVVMETYKTFTTWFGGKGGRYAVGVEGTVKCECVMPEDAGKPFDFLGLINIVGGAGGSKTQNLKSLADLIKWMNDNLRK
jgi:hypothetical protein